MITTSAGLPVLPCSVRSGLSDGMVTVSSYVPGPIRIVYGTVGFSGTAFTAACTLVYSAPLLATVNVTPVAAAAAAASPGNAVSRPAASAAPDAAARARRNVRARAGVTSMSATGHS